MSFALKFNSFSFFFAFREPPRADLDKYVKEPDSAGGNVYGRYPSRIRKRKIAGYAH